MKEANELIQIVQKIDKAAILLSMKNNINKLLNSRQKEKFLTDKEIDLCTANIIFGCTYILMKESIEKKGISFTRNHAANGFVILPYDET